MAGCEQAGHLFEPLGMPWDEHQPQPRVRRSQLTVGFDGQSFFRILRAAGQQHDVIGNEAGRRAQGGRRRIVAVGLGSVELQRTGDFHPLRRSTQANEAVGILRVLCRDQIELGQ